MLKSIIIALLMIVTVPISYAYANEEKIKKESNGVVDFIPFFQEQTRAMGQTPPKPFHIAPMYFYMEDYMNVSDVTAFGKLTSIGNGLYPADVEMNDVTVNTNSAGIRVGANIFPFLSIFGMYLHTEGHTKFKATAIMPGVLNGPYTVNNKMKFSADTYGIGANAMYGIPKAFLGWDVFGLFNINFAWSTANLIDNVLTTLVFSPRIGMARNLGKDMQVAFWFGGMYKEMLNQSEWIQGRYKITVPKDKFDTSEGSLGNSLGLGNSDQEVESQYYARQRPEAPWNLVIGGAFSPCRYFTVNSEVGFINRLTVNVGLTFNF